MIYVKGGVCVQCAFIDFSQRRLLRFTPNLLILPILAHFGRQISHYFCQVLNDGLQ